jgi:hypothetical protein
MSAASLLQKVAKTAATAKVAGFNKAIKKVSSVKNRLEVTAHQVSFQITSAFLHHKHIGYQPI